MPECSITVHSRITGYYTGDVFNTWNEGKKQEFLKRKQLKMIELPENEENND